MGTPGPEDKPKVLNVAEQWGRALPISQPRLPTLSLTPASPRSASPLQGHPLPGAFDCVLALHTPLHMASSFKSQRMHASSEKPFQTPRMRPGPPDIHYQRALCPSSEHACSVEYAKGLAHSRLPLKVMTLMDTGHCTPFKPE